MNAPDTEAVEGWKSRWRLCLCCNDCNTVYEVEPDTLSVSLQQTRPFTRVVALPVPEGCPKCHNMRVVKGPKRG
jgi:hypothetical protein